jgi:hypothetical protein
MACGDAVDLWPRDTSMPILEFQAAPGGRIRKDLEPPQDRVLDQSMLEERRTPVADVVVDRADCARRCVRASACRVRRSPRDGFAPDPLRVATIAGELLHIDLAAKGSLQIKDHCAQIDGGAVGIEVDEEIEMLSGAAPPLATEPKSRMVGAGPLRDSLDLRAPLAKVIEGHRQHSLRPDHGRHGRRVRRHDSRCGRGEPQNASAARDRCVARAETRSVGANVHFRSRAVALRTAPDAPAARGMKMVLGRLLSGADPTVGRSGTGAFWEDAVGQAALDDALRARACSLWAAPATCPGCAASTYRSLSFARCSPPLIEARRLS